MRPFKFELAVSAVLLVAGARVWAAACCAGSAVVPALITTDDQAQLAVSMSYGQVIGDAPPSGLPVFRAPDDTEALQTFEISGATLISDRWQLGANLPLVRRYRQVGSTAAGASSVGFGDVGLSAAYEVLPEWDYSTWRPHGYIFVKLTAPTGGSTFSATEPWAVDARGRGFFVASLGSAWIKTWGLWSASFLFEGHRSFSRTFDLDASSSQTQVDLHPGWGGSALLNFGFNPGNGPFQLGLGVSPIYEGAIETSGALSSVSESQLVWNTIFQLTYQINPAWYAMAAYTDQTLLGPAQNVALDRTFSVQLQKRWER